jgi:stage V sporulation protein B
VGDDGTRLREAGRGFLFITGAKLYFLVTATFTSLAFPRLFGDPVLFGRFRVVSALLNVVTMVVITATVQGVSRLASEHGADLGRVRRTSLALQAMLFGPVFLAMFAGAGLIASGLLGDALLGTPIRVASIVVLAYAFYAALVGLFNGTRRFGRQAGLDVTFSTLKTGLMIAAVVATGSVAWAFGAFAAAAVAVLAVAAVLARTTLWDAPRDPSLALAPLLRFVLPLSGYALVLNLLLQADVIGLKAVLGQGAADADVASATAGIYGAAKNVALLPYQAVISLTFVVFPLVSAAASAGDRAGAGGAASGAMRLAALLACGSVALLGAALLFGAAYVQGAPVLLMLLAAGALMALMHVGNAIVASAGRPWVSVLGGVWAVVVQLGLMAALLPGRDGPAASSAAALATLVGAAAGAAVAGTLVVRVFGRAPWLWTLLGASAAAAAGLGLALAPGPWLPWPVRPVVAGLGYVAVLFATRAVRLDDLAMLRRAFGRR